MVTRLHGPHHERYTLIHCGLCVKLLKSDCYGFLRLRLVLSLKAGATAVPTLSVPCAKVTVLRVSCDLAAICLATDAGRSTSIKRALLGHGVVFAMGTNVRPRRQKTLPSSPHPFGTTVGE